MNRPTRRAAPFGVGLCLLAAAAALSLGSVGIISSRPAGFPPVAGFIAGALAGILAILGLPSTPSRWSALAVFAMGSLMILRYVGRFGVDSPVLLLWGLSAVALFVLSDRLDIDGVNAAAAEGRPPPSAREPTGRWVSSNLRVIAITTLAVVALAVLLVPLFARSGSAAESAGGDVSPSSVGQSPSSMRASGRLDMTTRPRLSDAVVMTVQADRPAFWRGEVFDTWDGQSWTRSNETVRVVTEGGTGTVRPDPTQPAGGERTTLTQTFRIRGTFSNLVFAAPDAVKVTSRSPVVQKVDGTLVSGPNGTGASYTVTSSRVPVTDDTLATATGPTPKAVADQYAGPPKTTARVTALAKEITKDQNTTLGKVQAIEAWMGKHTTYSIDAPLSPPGADVVDHFLFVSREGWCEQIASSEVVLLRAAGVPARLATGFVSGEIDRVSGEFTVRERDAHAWTEVWFPGVGWQDFDPTASVPLAGDAHAPWSLFGWLRDHKALVVVVAVLAFLALAALPTLLRRRRTRRGGVGAKPRRRRSWAAAQVARLEQVGRVRASRARSPSETPSSYAAVLADLLGEPRLRRVGATLDATLYADAPVGPDERSFVDTTLGELKPSPAERGTKRLRRRSG